MCFTKALGPRGLLHWVTFGGNSPLLGLNSIFHCAIPRGLIRWVTVWDNSPLLGLNSIKHPAIPRGLICDTTVGGNFPLIALLVDAILPRVGRRLPHNVQYPRKPPGHDVRDGVPRFLYFSYAFPDRHQWSVRTLPQHFPIKSWSLVGGAIKMSGIGVRVMKYMYFGSEIGLCELL